MAAIELARKTGVAQTQCRERRGAVGIVYCRRLGTVAQKSPHRVELGEGTLRDALDLLPRQPFRIGRLFLAQIRIHPAFRSR